MALDFQVDLDIPTRRMKCELAVIKALDVYFAKIGTTPCANALRVQQALENKIHREYPDTDEGRSQALRETFGDLGKFMRETSLYMVVVGSLKFLITDEVIAHRENPPVGWHVVKSNELRGVGYRLRICIDGKFVGYELTYEKSGIQIDSGVVPNPLFDR